MKHKLAQRTAVTIAAGALAVGASALFGGTAFAGNGSGQHNDVGGPGGSGGAANSNCLVPIGASAGVVGQGGPVSQCNATGGAAGAGGTGANY